MNLVVPIPCETRPYYNYFYEIFGLENNLAHPWEKKTLIQTYTMMNFCSGQ